MPERDSEPGAFRWLTAGASVLLPIIGVLTALIGVFEVGRGHIGGWYWVGSGVFLILADMAVDWVWGRHMASGRDGSDVNRRGSELVGQLVTVIDPIRHGSRGSVRAADTIWAAEGAEAASGTRVRVSGVKGTVLVVTRP